MTKRLISILMAFTLLAAMVLSLSSCECKHEWETIPGVEATCSENGCTDHQRCKKCGETEGYQTISSTGAHTSSGAATCITAERCTVCDKILTSSMGHSFEGTTDGTCIRCDFGVTFILPSTPQTIYVTSGYDEIYVVEGIKIERNQRSVDAYPKYDFIFTVQRTYHERGNNYSECIVHKWKLYDEDGIVIDSGSMYTDSIKVGEKARGTISFYVGSASGLQNGKTYRLGFQ